MFTRKPTENTDLDVAIASVFSEMASVNADSDEYQKMTERLVQLHSLRPTPWRVNPDVLLTAASNAIIVAMIIAYEQRHAFVTKALNVVKLR